MNRWIAVFAVTAAVAAYANEKPSESFVKTMKDLNTTAQAMRSHATAKDNDALAGDAAKMKELFTTVQTFWKTKNAEDAVNFASTGLKGATDLETAAKAKNDEGVAAATRAIGGTCMGCHSAHREKIADGSYEIK